MIGFDLEPTQRSLNQCRDDPRRDERQRRQESHMVLDLIFPLGDLGKRTGATFYEIIDPCPRFGHRQEKNIAILGAVFLNGAWRMP